MAGSHVFMALHHEEDLYIGRRGPQRCIGCCAGNAAAAAAGPCARPDQIALYELLLPPLPAMDHAALQGPGTGGSGWVFVPGTPSCGESDGTPDRWEFSAEVFTADYAKGDSLAARAFASAHGDDGSFARITRVVTGYSDSGEIFHITSGGIDPGSAQFKRYDTSDSTSELHWDRARMSHAALTRIDLTQPREMFDPKAVWFDPNLGFVTANENIVPENNWAETVVVTVVIGVATWGVGSAICAAYGVTNAIAVGAIMGATGSVIGGLFQNGTVHFEDVVRGAITGAIMGAVSQNLDAKGIDPKTGAVTDRGARIGAISGKARRRQSGRQLRPH